MKSISALVVKQWLSEWDDAKFEPVPPRGKPEPQFYVFSISAYDFILEKLVGLNDRDAALCAGYSLSVAENTKQRIWKPQVRAEWERLRCELAARLVC